MSNSSSKKTSSLDPSVCIKHKGQKLYSWQLPLATKALFVAALPFAVFSSLSLMIVLLDFRIFTFLKSKMPLETMFNYFLFYSTIPFILASLYNAIYLKLRNTDIWFFKFLRKSSLLVFSLLMGLVFTYLQTSLFAYSFSLPHRPHGNEGPKGFVAGIFIIMFLIPALPIFSALSMWFLRASRKIATELLESSSSMIKSLIRQLLQRPILCLVIIIAVVLTNYNIWETFDYRLSLS